jgi:IS30 family transposase
MKQYTQLTEQQQRHQISVLMKAGHNQSEIAILIGVHKSSISRELCRNRGLRGYRLRQAQLLRQARREASYQPRLPVRLWARVERWPREEWSPEQISDWLRKREGIGLSHEWVDQYIYQDKAEGGTCTGTCAARRNARSVMAVISAVEAWRIKSVLISAPPLLTGRRV